VDRYENDNFWQQANTIVYDESQLHAFHAQPGNTTPDVDWVRFVATSASPLVIRTSAVGAAAQPNTRLTLFAGDGVTVLAVNDDLSASDTFSRITTTLTPGATYFVRAENLSPSGTPGFTGQYYFSLFACFDQTAAEVQGAGTLCLNSTNNVFSVVGLPAGSTVAWTVNPANSNVISLSNTTGTTTFISAQNLGSAVLTATVTSGGCTAALTPKTVFVSGGYVSLQRSPDDAEVCIGSTVTVQATTFSGAVVTNWRVDNGQLLYVNGNEAGVQVSGSPGVTTVHADYDSTCPSGGSFTASTGFDVVESVNGYYCVMMRVGAPAAAVYPNPADAYVDIRSPFAAARPYRIELHNDRGGRVHGETARSSAVRVDTRSLPNGLYHLTLRQGNQSFNYNLSIQH
jgi:hypothetical protein